jgi:hypothetical protein
MEKLFENESKMEMTVLKKLPTVKKHKKRKAKKSQKKKNPN